VTVILKSEAGGRRWQHFARDGGNGMERGGHGPQRPADPQQQRTESNYTVILGSHRNSCIKVEKDGQLCDRVGLSTPHRTRNMLNLLTSTTYQVRTVGYG
jgi:hypothetical protein